MTDAPETPVEVIAGEILPAPKKRGRKKIPGKDHSAPDRQRSGVSLGSGNRAAWLRNARVIDLLAFGRLREAELGAKRIARALNSTVSTAQKLMNGLHWQQTPEKVRLFNKARGGSIDAETGVPTPEDLAKFGGAYEGPTRHDTQGEKDLREIVESSGIAPQFIEDTVRRMKLLSGMLQTGDLPGKPDTKFFQDAFDEKLKLALACLDPVAIASASVSDLTRLTSMLTEKRALLRGEPTAIVRNEQRGGLDKVAALLLEEVKRRGITLDIPKGPGGYQVVGGQNAED